MTMRDEKYQQESIGNYLADGEIENGDTKVCNMMHNNSGKRGRKRKRRNRNRNKFRGGQQNKRICNTDRRFKIQQQLEKADGFCVFFMQGKCQKTDCPFSHEVTQPMRLELCKFYVKDCCIRGEKCLYMHSEFPCKFYHTGLPCLEEKNCKFAHGKALNDGLRQLLHRHIIETASRDNLDGFPRISGKEALDMIESTQNRLAQKSWQQTKPHGGSYSDKQGPGSDGRSCDLLDTNVIELAELSGKDHTKSGNKQNRPSKWQQDMPQQEPKTQSQSGSGPVGLLAKDMRISPNGNTDMSTLFVPPLPQFIESSYATATADDASEQLTDIRINPFGDIDMRPTLSNLDKWVISPEQNLFDLLKAQHNLVYLRVQDMQKNNLVESNSNASNDDDYNKWYSDDSDNEAGRLVIDFGNDEPNKEDTRSPPQEPANYDPSTMKNPWLASNSTEEKLSIYQQGSLENGESRTTRPNVDLRNRALPAEEMDASIHSSHRPMVWSLPKLDIPRTDYTAFKLSVQYDEKTSDPRLSMSPEPSPKASNIKRIDPRLEKLEVEKQSDSTTNYTQQPNKLTLPREFFQSLTWNQKLLLNQELTPRNDQTGFYDPVLRCAPSIPNQPPDFSINFAPRNDVLLGNAPPPINNYMGNFQSFLNGDYYDQGPPQQNQQDQQQNFHCMNNSRRFKSARRRKQQFPQHQQLRQQTEQQQEQPEPAFNAIAFSPVSIED